MAAWDWYPYDEYCEKLSWDWLWYGPGPFPNLANEQSVLNVKFDEGAYNAYRKGGFTYAEGWKDCIVNRYRAIVTGKTTFVDKPSVEQYALHLSMRLVRAVAKAKADIEHEAALREGAARYFTRSGEPATVTPEEMRYVSNVGPGGTISVPIPPPLPPVPPVDIEPYGPYLPGYPEPEPEPEPSKAMLYGMVIVGAVAVGGLAYYLGAKS